MHQTTPKISILLFLLVVFTVEAKVAIVPQMIDLNKAKENGIHIETEIKLDQLFVQIKIDQEKLCQLKQVKLVVFGQDSHIVNTSMKLENDYYNFHINPNYVEKSRILFECDSVNNWSRMMTLQGLN